MYGDSQEVEFERSLPIMHSTTSFIHNKQGGVHYSRPLWSNHTQAYQVEHRDVDPLSPNLNRGPLHRFLSTLRDVDLDFQRFKPKPRHVTQILEP